MIFGFVEGNATRFSLKIEESPFDGDLYFRAWAKNVAGYGVGSVKKVIFAEEPSAWWGATEELSGGWKNSSWLGAFRTPMMGGGYTMPVWAGSTPAKLGQSVAMERKGWMVMDRV